MITFGSGYNCCFLERKKENILEIPDFVSHIELGLYEYKKWVSRRLQFSGNLSLHLARTPIAEDEKTQRNFIAFLLDSLADNKDGYSKLSSIGVHLIGDRYQGIGRFGFSTHFTPTQTIIDSSCRFIEMLAEALNLPIWIENANFYSASSYEVFQTWESVTSILERTNAGIIVDLSHLFIDSMNNNIPPLMTLGSVPQKFIKEVHLSGVIRSKDGAYHDGHSCSVSEEIWELLPYLMKNMINKEQEIVLTIEHTDPIWITKKTEFFNDFHRLHQVVPELCLTNGRNIPNKRSEQYAKNYLKKILRERCRLSVLELEKNNLNFNEVFDKWVEFATENGKRIAFTKEEVPKKEWENVNFAKDSFCEYIEEILH